MKQLLFICFLLTTLIACQKRVIYEDDFTVPSADWILEEDAYGASYYGNEKLVIELEKARSIQYVTLELDAEENQEVSVDMTIEEGAKSSSGGILFRLHSLEQFYHFAVNGSGQYTIQQYNGGLWKNLSPQDVWNSSPYIKPGLNVTNRLRIAISNKERVAVFSINGDVVYRLENFNPDYLSGRVALSAGSFAEEKTVVTFDDFQYLEP